MRNVIYLSKDILRKDYLQPYNSKVETPNIQRLADEGTVFNNYYCSSPSSGMAASCLFSGLSAYQLDRKTFKEVDKFEQTSTVFSEFEDRGVKTHVLWTKEFRHLALDHSKIFDDRTDLVWLDLASSIVSPQKHAFDKVKSNSKGDNNYSKSVANGAEVYFKKIEEISQTPSPWFLWCHLPHVFLPFDNYGSDIHLFDWLVRQIRDKNEAKKS